MNMYNRYDPSTPFRGEVWAARDKIEAVRAMTKEVGNADFTFYPIEDALGGCDLNRHRETYAKQRHNLIL